MKIHGGRDHPNGWRNYFADCPVVRLNGNRVDHVVEADDVKGYVIVELRDARGRPVVDDAGKAIATRRRDGTVKIAGRRMRASQLTGRRTGPCNT